MEQNTNERERAMLMREGELLEQKLKYLGSQLERLSMVLLELGKARESFKGINENTEGLVQLGGEVLAEVKFLSSSVFFPIGAGYFLKMSREEAEKKIEEMIENINKDYKRIKEEVKQSETQLIDLLRKVQQV